MKILLFDDHRIFGESLSKLLEDWDEISICRYVSNETEFWNILSVDEWDIVLLDVNLREQSKSSGIDLIETIYSKKPKIKVVMLSSYDMPVYRQEALKKGAVSYIDKSASADELVKKLTAISKGHKSTTPPLLDPLTDREAEIIKAIGISIPVFAQIGIIIGLFSEEDDVSEIFTVIFLGEICLLFIALVTWFIYILL